MVQASILILATAVVAPIAFAAPTFRPLDADVSYIRSAEVNNVDALESREPFKFGRLLKKGFNVAKKFAGPAASLLLRDEEGNIYTRDGGVVALEGLSERGFASDVDEALELRDPKFRLGGFLKKGFNVAKKFAGPAASLLLRDEEGNVYVRDVADLTERDLTTLEEMMFERDSLGNVDADTLEARKLKFSTLVRKATRITGKAANVAGKVTNIANRVGGIAGRLGLRDFDEVELEARAMDELD